MLILPFSQPGLKFFKVNSGERKWKGEGEEKQHGEEEEKEKRKMAGGGKPV